MSRQLSLSAGSLVFFCFAAFAEDGQPGVDRIRQINAAIQTNGARWTAGENWVTRLPDEERRRLCGTRLEPPDLSNIRKITLPKIQNPPTSFDWRDNNGNWLTPVRSQGTCGSCWDFATVAQVEAWWKIHNAMPDSMIDLSEQFVLSCGNAGKCTGGSTWAALDFFKTTGVPLETCMGYSGNDAIPCTTACEDWKEKAVKIPGWGVITWNDADPGQIKSAVFRQPVTASFPVYEDFNFYSRGVYEHVWGRYVGGHAVPIVGWDDGEQSWICKNSWGADWGDGGYFRIKWGDCGIGKWTPFIWEAVADSEAMSISQDVSEFCAILGDSLNGTLTVTNQGANDLEFYAAGMDGPVAFHPDTSNAWDGLSWWCGDPRLGGYDNTWLQYLDTPVLRLTQTVSPRLACMVKWNVEKPDVIEEYDGYDGCNIWISINGGRSFEVARPRSPAYTSQSLTGFGVSPFFNMGPGIAGWGGTSGGWVPVELDLSPYQSDSTVVRFAFASDPGLCTTDDLSLNGFFVDDISISDGAEVIFEDHGDNLKGMWRTGFGIDGPG